jgi:hypothetical protein
LEKFSKGELRLKSEEALLGYTEGQDMFVDVAADLVSGIVALGIYTAAVAAAPFTGGASIAVGIAAAAVSGAAIKTTVKFADAKSGGKEYDSLGKDLATGAFSGMLAPVSGGAGGAVAKTLATKLGVQAVKQTGKDVVETGIKQTAACATVFIAENATAGAVFGGVDNAFRTAYDGGSAGEIVEAAGTGAVMGAAGGIVLGAGVKAVGKGGKALGKQIKGKAEDVPQGGKPAEPQPATKPEEVPHRSTAEIQAKMKQLSEKRTVLGKEPLTPEQMSNPNFQHNIDLILALCEFNRGMLRIEWDCFMAKPYSMGIEAFSGLSASVTSRFVMKGFPLDILEQISKTRKSMKKTPEFTPEIPKIEPEGIDLMSWYQSFTKNSAEVNSCLRKELPLSGDAERFVKFFDKHQKPLGENTVLMRALDDYPNFTPSQFKKGDVFTDRGFGSTTTNVENLDGLDLYPSKNFFVIEAPANTKAVVAKDWRTYEGMSEIILPRNTKFEVIDNIAIKGDKHIITLRIIE